jgi:hypothetical protein
MMGPSQAPKLKLMQVLLKLTDAAPLNCVLMQVLLLKLADAQTSTSFR